MRFVAIKAISQQDQQSLHRIRSQAVAHRTAQVNQIRALLVACGIEIARCRHHVARHLPDILEAAESGLTVPKTATALLASIGDIKSFRNGRALAAWLGLVPRQHATGGKEVLLGISKRGDRYLRSLLVHGARTVLHHAQNKEAPQSQWLQRLLTRRHKNVARVALANKMARTVYALLAYGEDVRSDYGLAQA